MMNVSYKNYDSARVMKTPLTLDPLNDELTDHWMQIWIFKCHPDLISVDE